ncbi:substrate-binding domain-containing protein [Thioalkalivibrio sp. XN279]|uniref:substrate-binding domain-containing protein n=1 Tax=Thioalkalivibrio sp. XN279 TaxID=2714953 RepID=UPI00351B5126
MSAQDGRFIVLASTTSTQNTGLFSHLVPLFRSATGIDVRVVAVGTGQAFAIARNGDADCLLVHDTAGEEQMVAEGFATERRDVMYNDFVVIGPAKDPAGVKAARTAAEAFRMIREKEAIFASRGDDSGTHRAEQRIWESAGGLPKASWYRELGSGMGATLNSAAAMDAYVLADRGSWIAFANRQDLEIVFAGDPVLFNQYGSLLLSPERLPHLKHDLAQAWHEWLVSAAGQSAIADFKVRGEQLFFPSAHSD